MARWGGYPGAEPFRSDEARWRSYVIKAIVDAVIGRDILMQKIARDPDWFRQDFAIEVKSGRRKKTGRVDALLQIEKNGHTLSY